MVRIAFNAPDPATAWRVRDALASHPLLGGATAHITIIACHHSVTLEGWTVDDEVQRIALHLARRAAGRRPVQLRLQRRSVEA